MMLFVCEFFACICTEYKVRIFILYLPGTIFLLMLRLRLNSKISESLVNIVLAESDSKVDPDISTDPSVPVRRMFFVDFSNQLNNG